MGLYEGSEYLEKNPDWHQEDSPWKAQHVLKILQKNGIEPKNVVDVGCGAGSLLAVLRDGLGAGTRLVGYDIAPAAIELAKRHETENIRFFCRDFLQTDERDFDLLLLMDVFEHIPDYMGFLARVRTRASYYVFHIPLDMNLAHLLTDRQITSRDQAGHLHYFSKATGLRTLDDTGYEVIDWCYTRVFETAKARRSVLKLILALPRLVGMALNPDLSVKLLGGCSLLVLARPRQLV